MHRCTYTKALISVKPEWPDQYISYMKQWKDQQTPNSVLLFGGVTANIRLDATLRATRYYKRSGRVYLSFDI